MKLPRLNRTSENGGFGLQSVSADGNLTFSGSRPGADFMLLRPPSLAEMWRVALATAVTLWLHGLMSSDAQASCGDWLDDSAMTSEGVHPPGGKAPVPCRQGECRQAPTQPLPTPPSPTVQRDQERWCHWDGVLLGLASESSRLWWLETVLLPEGHPARIERPPRA